jgi:hypothetical protein
MQSIYVMPILLGLVETHQAHQQTTSTTTSPPPHHTADRDPRPASRSVGGARQLALWASASCVAYFTRTMPVQPAIGTCKGPAVSSSVWEIARCCTEASKKKHVDCFRRNVSKTPVTQAGLRHGYRAAGSPCSHTDTRRLRPPISRQSTPDQITVACFVSATMYGHVYILFLFHACSANSASLNDADCIALLYRPSPLPLQKPGLPCNPILPVIAAHTKVWGIV